MIAPMDVHECTFEIDGHVYRDAEGRIYPSTTQIIRDVGLVDYSNVPVEILARKAAIGADVHEITATFDREGDFDPSWLTEDTTGYVAAWKRFRMESGYEMKEIERTGLVEVHGMKWGMTLDRIAISGKEEHLLEIKCTSAKHPSWGIQLASYEIGYTGRARCGHLRRTAVQLKPNGSYAVHAYDDARDADIFLAALALTNWKNHHGLQAA